ncbi:BnaC05g03800D [Brassica napus]|uniref:BnaC05g03800D protein n=1 Tax=Brassica napus TaxID=3708 RepID=A0A078FAT3_BRANA|nr:BnaC05g03800D [Brassica napus]
MKEKGLKPNSYTYDDRGRHSS